MSIQEAIYANADALYDPATGAREAMPRVNRARGLIIHLPAGQGRCELHWVDLVAGWKGVRLALSVRDWRKRKDLHLPYVPIDPVAERRAWLIDRVRWLAANELPAAQALAAGWPTDVPTLKTDGHSAEQLDEIAIALRRVEATFHISFPDQPDPQHNTTKGQTT
jgi:hypothetical protein